MKVRVTHEIPDEARIALNLALNGSLTPATRETCEAWLLQTMEVEIGEMHDAFTEVRDAMLEKLKT